MVGPDRAVILPQLSLKISMFGALLGLFYPALDAAELTNFATHFYRSSGLRQWRR